MRLILIRFRSMVKAQNLTNIETTLTSPSRSFVLVIRTCVSGSHTVSISAQLKFSFGHQQGFSFTQTLNHKERKKALENLSLDEHFQIPVEQLELKLSCPSLPKTIRLFTNSGNFMAANIL